MVRLDIKQIPDHAETHIPKIHFMHAYKAVTQAEHCTPQMFMAC